MLRSVFKQFWLFALLLPTLMMAQVDGRGVYKANCASCHKMNARMTGPALDGAFDRIQKGHPGFDETQTTEWMVKWIKNSQAMIASGDDYAVNLFNEYNKSVMNSFITLPEEEVLAVIDYIRYWQDETKYPAEVVQTAGGEADIVSVDDSAAKSDSAQTILYVVLIALIIASVILYFFSSSMNRLAMKKEGVDLPESRPLFKRPVILTVIAVAVVTVGFLKLTEGAIGLGRQQNYQPAQPIKFSHKLHAGLNQTDCKYCHVGVERGKQATIPSVNVCMNCHKAVQEGPKYGKTEIAKIYEAAGWNPDKMSYDRAGKPVEWVRIHNLPDHVYFNHQQHVKVGQIECQQCHGEIQEMEEVYQYSNLSMGWCLNCHRETQVQFADNNYYSEEAFDQYHQDMKDGKIKGVTVEMIGGTECQKCHY